MNYQIITDEEKLKEFIDWLPDLLPHECYYVSLFARSKYSFLIKGDKAKLKRFTTNKERLIDKIKQLECAVGSYKSNGIDVPQEALALYINPNPRSNIEAAKTSLKLIADLITGDKKDYNLHQEILTVLQKSNSRQIFKDFDFDGDKEKLSAVYNDISKGFYLNKEAATIVETRGGLHLLIEPSKVDDYRVKFWYNSIVKLHQEFSTDTKNKGDNMLPVPGTYQGGFTPKLYKFL